MVTADSRVAAVTLYKTSSRFQSRSIRRSSMKFASTRLIARDIQAVVGFYEKLTNGKAEWLGPVFAEIVTKGATLAIGSVETVALFKEGTVEPAANRTAIIEFQVD